MLSNPQKSLLKRAQREAGLSDIEYRDALGTVAGCRSSTDPNMTDRDLDKLLAYFEAIAWRGFDAGTLQRSSSPAAVFRQRGFWSSRNTAQETSRDRYRTANSADDISRLEAELRELGFGAGYCASIRKKVTHGRNDAHALYLYGAALKRTIAAKSKRPDPDKIPF